MTLRFSALLVLIAATAVFTQEFSCYSSNDEGIIGSYNVTNIEVCARYDTTCDQFSFGCTSEEISMQANKTIYTHLDVDICDQYKASPYYRNVLCCSTSYCNEIMPASDYVACYYGTGGGSIDNYQTYWAPIDKYVCAKFDFMCADGIDLCFQPEINSKANKTALIYALIEECPGDIAAQHSYATNITCCSTNLCNFPNYVANSPQTKNSSAEAFAAFATLSLIIFAFAF